jgi:hypothetical protein
MTTLNWIDVMGLPHQTIEATVIGDRVFVDEDNLGTMEASTLEAQITDPESTASFAEAIRNTGRDADTGLFDVTDFFAFDELNTLEDWIIS